MSDRRLFFALWPDDATRHQLHHWQTHNLPGELRWHHRDDLHLTLHFLGAVGQERVESLLSLGDSLGQSGFTLVLDEIGHWSGPGVLWAGPSSLPGELLDLHGALGAGLEKAGFELERRPYRPHVTLARKVREKPMTQPLQPLTWRADDLALVESRPGSAPMYKPVRHWHLE